MSTKHLMLPWLPCGGSSSLYTPGKWIIIAFVLGLHSCYGNLCLESDSAVVKDVLHEHSTPQGGVNAGKYYKDPHSKSLPECLYSCCKRDDCNTVFFHKKTCFLITCNTTHPKACKPQHRTGNKFVNTVMIEVKPIEETSQYLKGIGNTLDLGSDEDDDGQELDEAPDLGNVQIHNECSPDDINSCNIGEECDFVVADDMVTVGYMCQCIDGYRMDIIRGHCVADISFTTTSDLARQRSEDVSCSMGLLLECERNEKCVPINSHSRFGSCHCIEEFSRNQDTGFCEPDTDETVPIEVKHKNETVIHTISTVKKLKSTISPSSTPASPTATSTKASVEALVVSAGQDKVIELPHSEVTLSAYAVPQDLAEDYKYEWSLISHPEGEQVGQMVGINTANLQLSKLIAGLYTFKVAVSADGKYGEGLVNVTVKPPAHENEVPVALINPPFQEINQPNDVVLDGSQSSDDDKIVAYKWQLVSGPLNYHNVDQSNLETPMIVLKGLGPGKYRIKLTVTDSDGVENSTFANVTVIKETDYPPNANAGSNVIISLPQNSVSLYGNASTDDKGIESYEWIKKSDDKLTADMKGVRTPFLHLENLEEGDYTFTLKVKDTSQQVSTADVHVFVKQEHNKPPVANAGKDRTVWLPMSTITLDGTNSTDDQKIASYAWSQVSGPTTVAVENADRAVATAAKLVVGQYKFKLSLADQEGLQATDYITITVKQNENHAPIANAGGDMVMEMPLSLVTVDGSKSSDDKGIVSYQWSRSDKSLAAGNIVNHSDHSPILQLVDLVEGRYIFTLTVRDTEGLSDSDTSSIIVRPDTHHKDLVQLHLDVDITSFFEISKRNLQNQIALLLHRTQQSGDMKVAIQRLSQASGHLVVDFFVTAKSVSGETVIQPGTEVAATLKKKLKSDSDVLDFRILKVDTVVCQNNCSGHGHCDAISKKCICEAFWMENFFKSRLMDESNCEWSILYVIIIAFITVVTVAGIIWALICVFKRWYRFRPKKRHRYTLLEEMDEEQKDNTEMIPRGKIQNSSLMVSESDFSSDEETLFINNKKTNGHLKNGLVKPSKNKIKT